MMLIKVVYILFFFNFQSFEAKIITVNDFPNTEKLNYEGLGPQNWVHHNVKLESIPLNGSAYSSIFSNAGRVTTIHRFSVLIIVQKLLATLVRNSTIQRILV